MLDRFEDPSEYVGDLGWIGCPHCYGPVNAKPLRDQMMLAFLHRMIELIEGGRVAQADFVKRLRIMSADVYESGRADLAVGFYPLSLLDDLDPPEPDSEDEDEPEGGA